MLLGILASILLGVTFGTITGLIPGIHTNLIATLFITSAYALNLFKTNTIIIFFVALSITHTFVDFIPSIYFGAPSEETIFSSLPGHKFLLMGRAHLAIKLTAIGSLLAIFIFLITTPIFFYLLPKFYPFIKKMMSFILILTLIFLIQKEKEEKIWTIIIVFLASIVGIITLNSNINQPLLPLLTGLFASSNLINSIQSNTIPPKQNTSKIKIEKKQLIKPAILTMIISPLCSILPGLGASQAATIASSLSKKQNQNTFLILLGSINTLVLATSFLTLYLINKSRTGIANAISQITQLDIPKIKIIILTIIITSIISYFITLKISKLIAKRIHLINYKKYSIIILIILTIIIPLLSGINGLLVFITTTLLGLITIKLEISKGLLMSSILIPTIIYYLPI